MGTSSNVVDVTGKAFESVASFTRPANTTAYTALDVVGAADTVTPANAGSAILTFSEASRAERVVQILSADLSIALTSVPSGMTSFKLHLYSETPTNAILDNAAFSTATADRQNYLGSINFSIGVIDAGFLYASVDYIGRTIKTPTADIYGVLQTIGAFTPASGTGYTVAIRTLELG
jgi:hypothetical protein